MEDLAWEIASIFAAIAVCGAWFYRCAQADRARQVRAFARRTLSYAGPGFVLGIALLTSDLGKPPMGLVALTACCGLLVYAAGAALVVADDQSLVLVNLTGRALLLAADPQLAPFCMLPAPQDDPATELPPSIPRTCYVVNPPLAQLGARAGRTDMYMVDQSTARDMGDAGLLVKRLVCLVPQAPALGSPQPPA